MTFRVVKPMIPHPDEPIIEVPHALPSLIALHFLFPVPHGLLPGIGLAPGLFLGPVYYACRPLST